MRPSAKTEYACLALLALASRDAAAPPLRVREIAEARGIPERYLVQILLRLKNAGLVESVRGASGGYRLARGADAINLAEVFEAFEGSGFQGHRGEDRWREALEETWTRCDAARVEVLRETSLARLLQHAQTPEWVI